MNQYKNTVNNNSYDIYMSCEYRLEDTTYCVDLSDTCQEEYTSHTHGECPGDPCLNDNVEDCPTSCSNDNVEDCPTSCSNVDPCNIPVEWLTNFMENVRLNGGTLPDPCIPEPCIPPPPCPRPPCPPPPCPPHPLNIIMSQIYNYCYVPGFKTTHKPVMTYDLDPLSIDYATFMALFYSPGCQYFNINPSYQRSPLISLTHQTYRSDNPYIPHHIEFSLMNGLLKAYTIVCDGINDISPVTMIMTQKQVFQNYFLTTIKGSQYSLSWDDVWSQLLSSGYRYQEGSTTTVNFSVVLTYYSPPLDTEIIIKFNYLVPVENLI